MTTQELSQLLPHIMRGSIDFVTIDDRLKHTIEHVADWTNLVHIENDNKTVNWKYEELKDCNVNEYRLWTQSAWALTENARIKLCAKARIMKIEYDARIEHIARLKTRIIVYFEKLMIPSQVTDRTMLAPMVTVEQLTAFAEALKLDIS